VAEAATIARPYAKAAFQVARDSRELAAWSHAFRLAAGMVADARVAGALTSPKLSDESFVTFFEGLGGEAVDAQWKNFVRALAENKRLDVLPDIASQYEILRADFENEVDVQVTSAVPLGEDHLAKLAAALKRRLKREVRINAALDASLLGGAVIRAGDLVIDGSLAGGLQKLATELGS